MNIQNPLDTEPRKVLLVTDSADPSGVGRHMIDLADALLGQFQTELAFAEGKAGAEFAERARAEGLRAETVASWMAHFQKVRPSLVHVHSGIGWEGHRLVAAARRLGLPVVRTEHLPWLITDSAQQDDYGRMLAGVDRLVTVSDAAGESWRRALAGLSGNVRMDVVPNGIREAGKSRGRAEMRHSLCIDDTAPVILHVGRFAAQKDHATLIDAFSLLLKQHPDAHLLLAGEGETLSEVAAQVAALRLENVHLLGKRGDVADLMGAADLLALPSLFEGLPLVLLEAIAAGLPIVATRIGGVTEVLGEDHPWLVASKAPQELAAALSRAIADPVARQAVEARQRARFGSQFSAERMARDTAQIYRDVLATPKAKTQAADARGRTRIGFIGAGGIAHRHFGVLERFADAVVVAVADTDNARAESAAERMGATPFSDYDQMLAEADLDAVFICVPPFAHGAPERAAIKHGLPFFVEKPVALDMALAEEIAEAVEMTGLITAVGYHWRYLDTVESARRLLAANPAQLMNGYWLDSTPPPAWWHDEARSGGQVVEQATHIIDLARVIAGEVVMVAGIANHLPRAAYPNLTVATASAATLGFASGAVASMTSSCLLNWQHRVGLEVFADGLALALTDHDIMIDRGRGQSFRGAEGDPVWREDRDFIDAVRGTENRIRTPYADAVETLRVTLAVTEAARTGSVVTLPPRRELGLKTFAPLCREPVQRDQTRCVRSLGVEAPLRPYFFEYQEEPMRDGHVRLDLVYTGYSAGTELTFLKNTNPYLHSRWDDVAGVFVPGEASAHYPLPFMGYMEVARVIDSDAVGFAVGDVVATTFGHKTGHTAHPAHDLLTPLRPDLDPILGVFIAQMGPIAANGILHADAAALGANVPTLGAGIAGRNAVVWGGGTVGLLTALFARAAGVDDLIIAEPSSFRRDIACRLGLTALSEDEAWQYAKDNWRDKADGRGADVVFQTRARSESLNLALRSLRPQGMVVDLAFYQGGMDGARFGEEFHHNGLSIVCAQINRVPTALRQSWDRKRLSAETINLLKRDGQAIRDHMITHVVPFADAADFLTELVHERPDFLQIVFENTN